MHISPSGLNLIKQFEGLSLKPYLCPAGVPSIGYGSTRYADGRAVTLHDPAISVAQAETLLRETLHTYEQGVLHACTVALSQTQFDALVALAYNIGLGNFSGSTLVRKLNAGDVLGAAAEFGKWTHAKGQVLPGLVKRRAAERALFLGKANAHAGADA